MHILIAINEHGDEWLVLAREPVSEDEEWINDWLNEDVNTQVELDADEVSGPGVYQVNYDPKHGHNVSSFTEIQPIYTEISWSPAGHFPTPADPGLAVQPAQPSK